MRAAVAFLALFMVASPVQARKHCDMATAREEVRWCLVESPADTAGRERMIEALQREGTTSALFFFRLGFADCYGGNREKVKNLLECRRADPMGLFNFGRQLIELPPVPGRS
jgi:hypothetical protein